VDRNIVNCGNGGLFDFDDSANVVEKKGENSLRRYGVGKKDSIQKPKKSKRHTGNNNEVSGEREQHVERHNDGGKKDILEHKDTSGRNVRSGKKGKTSEVVVTGERETKINSKEPTHESRRKRGKFVRTSEIMKPYTLVSQPIKSRTKEGVSEIEIDGLWYEVTSSSIIDGVYRQGLDSNFIVNYLTFKEDVLGSLKKHNK